MNVDTDSNQSRRKKRAWRESLHILNTVVLYLPRFLGKRSKNLKDFLCLLAPRFLSLPTALLNARRYAPLH